MNCVPSSSPWARQLEDDISPVSVAFGHVVHSTQPGATTAPGHAEGLRGPPPAAAAGAGRQPVASYTDSYGYPQPTYQSNPPPLTYWAPPAATAPENYTNYYASYSRPHVDPTNAHGGGVAPMNAAPAVAAHSKPLEPHPYAQYQPRMPVPSATQGYPHPAPSNAPSAAPGGGGGIVGGITDLIGRHEQTLMDEQTAAGAMSLLDVWSMRCESFESASTQHTEEDEEEEEDYGFFVEDSEWDDGSEIRKPAWPTSKLAKADKRKPLGQRVFQPASPSQYSTSTSSSPDAREPNSPGRLSISSPKGTKTVTHTQGQGQGSAVPLPPGLLITVQPHCQGGMWPPLQSTSAQPGPPPAHMTSVLSSSTANASPFVPSGNAPPFVPSGMAESEMGMYFHSLKLT